MRKLFKGGYYSRAETIWGNTVYSINTIYSVESQWRLGRSIHFFVLVHPYLFYCSKRVWIDQKKMVRINQDVIDGPQCTYKVFQLTRFSHNTKSRVSQGLGVEQLKSKLKKNIGIQEHARKVRKFRFQAKSWCLKAAPA